MENSELKSRILQNCHIERKDNKAEIRDGTTMYLHKSLEVFDCEELEEYKRKFNECNFKWVRKGSGSQILTGCTVPTEK